MNIIIIAGGPSVREYDVRDLTNKGFVIGVNDASLNAKVHTALSMDRLWVEDRWPTLRSNGVSLIARKAALKNVPMEAGLSHFDCDHTEARLSDVTGTLNGTNSGLCALNLAYQMRPDKLFLLGFDMQPAKNGDHYWYEKYPWKTGGSKYREWAPQFDEAAKQCKAVGIAVFNVNHRTAIKSFPVISFKQFLGM